MGVVADVEGLPSGHGFVTMWADRLSMWGVFYERSFTDAVAGADCTLMHWDRCGSGGHCGAFARTNSSDRGLRDYS